MTEISVQTITIDLLAAGLREVEKVNNPIKGNLGKSGGFAVNAKYAEAVAQSKELLELYKRLFAMDAKLLEKAGDGFKGADLSAAQQISR